LIGSVRLCLSDRYVQVSYDERNSHTKGMSLQQTVGGRDKLHVRWKAVLVSLSDLHRRTTTLFVVGAPFGFRVCMRLAYKSQRESAADTIRRRAIRILHVSRDTGSAFEYVLIEEDEFDEDPAEGEFGALAGTDGPYGEKAKRYITSLTHLCGRA
jgi:hypothetical protein